MSEPAESRTFRLPSPGWWIGACVVACAALVWFLLLRPIGAVNRFLREAEAAGCMIFLGHRHPRWFEWLESRFGIDDGLFIPGWDEIDRFTTPDLPIPDSWFDHLAAAETVRELYLEDSGVNDEQIARLRSVRGLRELRLSNSRVSDAGLRSLESHSELTSLVLDETQVTDESLSSLGRLTRLSSVGLGGTRVAGHGLRHLRALPELYDISLGGPALEDAAFEEIGHFPALRALSLRDNHLTAARCRSLRRCAKLDHLCLSDSVIDLDVFAELSQWPSLAAVEASWWKTPPSDLSTADLSPLLGLKTLSLLSLDRVGLTDDQIRPLAAHPKLHTLSVPGNDIHGRAFEAPGWNTLTSLDLSNTRCDDRVAATLARLPALESLNPHHRRLRRRPGAVSKAQGTVALARGFVIRRPKGTDREAPQSENFRRRHDARRPLGVTGARAGSAPIAARSASKGESDTTTRREGGHSTSRPTTTSNELFIDPTTCSLNQHSMQATNCR